MLRRGDGERPRRGERRRSRSRPESKRQEADGGVRAHWARVSKRCRAAVQCLNTNLDLQHIVASNTLVVHLVVGIVGISSVFVFDEGKAATLMSVTFVEKWQSLEASGYTDSLLDADRGAGMSQRTRRPYLKSNSASA